jgi:hypothetical protein
MDKSINYSKLDEVVKKALENYKTPYNSVDWAQMETMLDVAPKQISLPKSNSPILLLVLVTIGAAFILYMLLKPIETIDTATQLYKPVVIKKPFKPLKPTPAKTQQITVNKDTVKAIKEIKTTTETITATSKIGTVVSNSKTEAKTEVKTELKKTEKTEEEIKKEKAAKREEQLKREKRLKKEAQLKKEKAAKKEIKPEPKTEIKPETEIEETPLEEENDLNRKNQEPKPVVDTSSSVKKVKDSKDTKGGKKSRKDSKKLKKEKDSTTSPADENKAPSEIVNPVGE